MLNRCTAALIISIICCAELFAINTAQDSSYSRSYLYDSILVVSDKLGILAKNSSTHLEVLNAARISGSNGQRLSDILKTANSVFIKSYGPAPQLQSVSINGLGAEQTVVLLDGIKLNSYQNAGFDLSLLPKDIIGSIVIQSNGSSALYGSGAMGGVINIITRKHWDEAPEKYPHYSLTLSTGSMDTHHIGGSIGYRLKESSLNVFFHRETSDGDYPFHFQGQSARRKNNSYKTTDVGFNLGHIIDSTCTLSYTSLYDIQDRQLPGIETGNIPPLSTQLDRNWNNILSLENYFSKFIFLKLGFNFQNNYENYKVQPVTNSFYHNMVITGESELHFNTDWYKGIIAYNFTHSSINSNELSGFAQRNQHTGILSLESVIFNMVRLFPSVSADIIPDADKKVITYKMGFNITPGEESGFSIYGNYGKNFRMPTFNDMYWKEVGSKILAPEYSYNEELGARYGFNGNYSGVLDLNYTIIDATDKIVWTPQRNGIWRPQNVNKSASKTVSINASIEKSFDDNLLIKLNTGALFTDSRNTKEKYKGDPEYNKLFPYIPVQSMKVGITAKYKIVEGNLFYHHTGDRYSDFENLSSLPQQNLLDGNISVSSILAGQTVIARLEINNITNRDYQMIAGYPMPLRTYTLTLTIKR
jgi:iron complex outermembrane receptor protein